MSRMLSILAIAVVTAGCAAGGAHTRLVRADVPSEESRPTAASPLAAYAGFGHHEAEDEAQYQRDDLARQRLIATCMKQADFVYYPSATSVVIDPSMSQKEIDEATRDPNDDYVASLSPTARAKYWNALLGVDDPNQEEARLPYDPNRSYLESFGPRCAGDAGHAIPGVFTAAQLLKQQYGALIDRAESDPRVVAAKVAWASCMAAYGYPYPTRAALGEAVHREFIQAEETGNLQRAAEFEERTSAADDECDDEVRAMRDQARAELELDFVETHRDILDRYARRD